MKKYIELLKEKKIIDKIQILLDGLGEENANYPNVIKNILMIENMVCNDLYRAFVSGAVNMFLDAVVKELDFQIQEEEKSDVEFAIQIDSETLERILKSLF